MGIIKSSVLIDIRAFCRCLTSFARACVVLILSPSFIPSLGAKGRGAVAVASTTGPAASTEATSTAAATTVGASTATATTVGGRSGSSCCSCGCCSGDGDKWSNLILVRSKIKRKEGRFEVKG